MAERDGAAVDVQPFRIDRQLAQARQHLRGERFVQLDQIDLLERQPGGLQRLAYGRHRADAEAFGLDAGGREATNRASGCRPCSRANSADVTITAAAPSLVCDELPAVTVPVA